MNYSDQYQPNKDEILEATKSVAKFHGLDWDLFIPDEVEMCLLEVVSLLKNEGVGGPLIENTDWITELSKNRAF